MVECSGESRTLIIAATYALSALFVAQGLNQPIARSLLRAAPIAIVRAPQREAKQPPPGPLQLKRAILTRNIAGPPVPLWQPKGAQI